VTNGDDALLTPAEVARLYRISEETVLRAIRSGQLAAVRVGRKKIRIRAADAAGFAKPIPRPPKV
jgi:excisionase family DNA binding protein